MFIESKYLQKRIKQEFQHIVKLISAPVLPTAAIHVDVHRIKLIIRALFLSKTLKYICGCDMWRVSFN
jgi:hypothetical protein